MKAQKHRAGSVAGINFSCFFAKNPKRITLTCFNAPAVLAHLSNQSAPCIWFEWRELWRSFHYIRTRVLTKSFSLLLKTTQTWLTLLWTNPPMGCTFSKKHFRRFSKKQKVSKSPLLIIFVQNMNKTRYFSSFSFLKSVSVLSTFIHCDVIKRYAPF